MKSYIYLRNVKFHAFHGVMPQERAVGADFLVTLRIGFDVSGAMESDEVTDTLNYAEVYQLIKREMDQPSNLLEHVAGRMVKALNAAYPAITSIDLELTKLNPPMGADCQGAGVEIHFVEC